MVSWLERACAWPCRGLLEEASAEVAGLEEVGGGGVEGEADGLAGCDGLRGGDAGDDGGAAPCRAMDIDGVAQRLNDANSDLETGSARRGQAQALGADPEDRGLAC